MLEIIRSRGEYDGYSGTSGTLVQLRSMWILHSFLGVWRLVVDLHPSLLSHHSETFKRKFLLVWLTLMYDECSKVRSEDGGFGVSFDDDVVTFQFLGLIKLGAKSEKHVCVWM